MEEIIFPNQIRTYRKQHGCTMQELADELGMSLSAISKIEKGYRRLDQEQLIHVASFLNCRLQDLFVNDLNSKPEVVQAWKKEQERRSKINVSGGLKTMGAGLRQIRNEKNLTLIDVSEKAGMTLSVYHRIEMGQREVSDKEFKNLAKALGISPDKLRETIKVLDNKGILDEIIQKNNAKYRLLATPKGSNSIDSSKVFLYNIISKDGKTFIDFENQDEKINRPVYLQGKHMSYALHYCSDRFDDLLPAKALIFVDPMANIEHGDWAIYYLGENEIMFIKILQNGHKLYGLRTNPAEKIELKDSAKLHKVAIITL